MPPQTRLCEACQQLKPANKFLPSSLSPTGYLTKCLDCIRQTAEQHRLERARIADAAVRRGQEELAPTSQPVLDLASTRPVGRLPPELFEAARRFVFDFRDGNTQHIAGEMEPKLYALLEWLAEQSMLEAECRRRPEEVGRDILGYRDANTSRGVAYGALWAALVRAAAVYDRTNSQMIDGASRIPASPSRSQKCRA